jgi:hypothetical protein
MLLLQYSTICSVTNVESLVGFCFPLIAAMFGSAAQLRRKRAKADISFLLHGFQRLGRP